MLYIKGYLLFRMISTETTHNKTYISIVSIMGLILILEGLQLIPSSSSKASSDFHLGISFLMVILTTLFLGFEIPSNMKDTITYIIPMLTMFIPIVIFAIAKNNIKKVYENIEHTSAERYIIDTRNPFILGCHLIYFIMSLFYFWFIMFKLNKNMVGDNTISMKGLNTDNIVILLSIVLFSFVQAYVSLIFSWYRQILLQTTDDNFASTNCNENIYRTDSMS